MAIGIDFKGQPGHVPPNNWETPMHLALFLPPFAPHILVCPPNIFDRSMPVLMAPFDSENTWLNESWNDEKLL